MHHQEHVQNSQFKVQLQTYIFFQNSINNEQHETHTKLIYMGHGYGEIQVNSTVLYILRVVWQKHREVIPLLYT